MSLDALLLLLGVFRALIWWTGAALAIQQRRGLLVAGFGLAGCNAILQAAAAPTLIGLVSIPISVLIVGSFVVNQPKNRRPARWSL